MVTTCAGDNTVAALIEGALDGTAARRLEVHLDGCAHCRRLIADLGRGLSAIDPHRMPSEGEVVGRYTIRRAIGVGGMGVVYEAHDDVLDRRVAVKVLRPDGICDARVLLAEARAMARLSHRNIVTIHDAGTANGRVFLCMELVVGVTLREWLAAQRRSARDIIAMFAAAGAGLAYIHGERVVHLDFKPDNVLVDRAGRAVVTDFGVAAIVGRGPIGGTPRYMAPEQRRGEPADARADQYAFCTALREALGDTAPSWAKRAIERGRRVKAHDRFASMTELLAVLAAGLGRTRRRVIAVAGVAATVGLAIAIAQSPRSITRVVEHTAPERIVERVVAGAPSTPSELPASPGGDERPATAARSASVLAVDHALGHALGHASTEHGTVFAVGFPAVVTGALAASAQHADAGCDDGSPVSCQSDPPWCPPG
ncbi:MAG TPA: protein kinase, partial [Kofleriaceae bacterium]|nr:protein kinase [Kofleriaceae bacterium]